MKSLTVSEKEAGQRFDKYLARIFPKAPSGFIYKMLRKKNIVLNSKKAMGKEILQKNDFIELFLGEETLAKFSDAPESQKDRADIFKQQFEQNKMGIQIEIVYEDEDILIVNKPAGVLSQKALPQDYSLNEWLCGYLLKTGGLTPEELSYFKPSVCNRIDRNTSGLVLCGKTLRGSQFLSKGIHSGRQKFSFRKYYLAIVEGKINPTGSIIGYQEKNTDENKITFFSQPKTEKSEYVETAYRLIHYDAEKKVSLAEIRLLTGKTHQIRAGFSHIGHPLTGDHKYGSKWKGKRYCLHAARIEIPEFENGNWEDKYSGKIFKAPLPLYFEKWMPMEEYRKCQPGNHVV